MTIGGSLAASSICSSAAPAGAIVRPSMVPTRPSTIASIAGPNGDGGGRFSKPWPIAASTAYLVNRLHLDQGASLGERRKRGEHEQVIGRSRGGRTTKIHALSDPDCRPCAFHLTPGQDADIAAAPALLALAPPMSSLIADKGYDGDEFRADIVKRGAKPVIPNKSNRIATSAHTRGAMSIPHMRGQARRAEDG